MDGRGDRRRADERTTRRLSDGPLGRPGRAPAGTPAPLQVARHGAALGSRASGVVCHHSRGFPVAGEHHVGSRRAAAGELACQTYPSGVGGYAALEAGSPGRNRKPQKPYHLRRERDHAALWRRGGGSAQRVDLAALNRLSVESSPRWRAAIAAHSIIWQPGVTRLPIPGRRGRPSGRWGWARDANAYPIVTLDDRRRLAFGARDSKNRTRREVNGAWSDLPGLTVAERSAVDPKTGAVGWRLLPAPDPDGEGGG